MARRSELDALRGFMLVMITITHLPTFLANKLGQPFGFVSAAEGFVFLSAFLAGSIYADVARRKSLGAMRTALWRRAGKVYLAHAFVLVLLFTVIAAMAITNHSVAVQNLLSFYFREPATALWAGFSLIYNPPLLDILPMYVLFMLLSPLALSYALRSGWTPLLVASLGLWAGAQFGLSKLVYSVLVVLTNFPVPLNETGAFNLLAWQFMWVLGLWLGAESAPGHREVFRFPRWLVACALAIAACGLVGRHLFGQQPFAEDSVFKMLIDKWQLAPWRMVDFLALLIIVTRFGPALARRARWRFLEVLGAASLPVFCTQLVITLLALCALGDRQAATPVWEQLVLVGATFAALYAVGAMAGEAKQRRQARAGAALTAGAA